MFNSDLDTCELYAAAFSPFDRTGKVNLKPIPPLVDQLIHQGIHGFYLMGSTGEGLSITLEQRKQVTEAYMEAVDKRAKVIVNVSHTSYETATHLTRHATSLGVDAVSATLPSYYEISSLDQLIYGVQKIAECQDQVPFLYYHIPGKTRLNFKMHQFLEGIDHKLPQLGGIKYTSPAIDDFMLCTQLFGDRYKMFFGADELFLPALAMGANAFIGSTYNFMLPLYQSIVKHYARGERRKAIQAYFKVTQVIDTILGFDALASQKAVMKMIGHDFGITKSPVRPLSNQEYALLSGKLEEIHFLEPQEY